jgi:acyl carrier protein
MPSSLFDRVRGIAADVLEVSAAKISADSSPETNDTWDSVHHLNLVLALEQEFAVQFEPEEIDQMKDIQHILEILGSKVTQG